MKSISSACKLYVIALASMSLFIPATQAQVEQRGLELRSKASTERRVALVIGNSSYADSPLLNPRNDARDMAQMLRGFGFEIIFGEDLSQNDMKRSIRAFGEKIRSGGVGLFYFAGHGVQVNGRNYLIPIGAVVGKEEEIEYESVDVGFVLAQMENANNQLNIVILDACRNNPFARSFRSESRGLASIDAPSGTLIAYATAPGSVASDGNGKNGLYTQELLKFMRVMNLNVEQVFKQVRVSVRSLTQGKQTPWEASSLTGDFYFDSSEESVKAASEPSKPADMELTLTPKQYIKKGDELSDLGNWPDAELAYRQAVALEPNNQTWRFRLAEALDQNHKYQEHSKERARVGKENKWDEIESEARLTAALKPQSIWRHLLLGNVLNAASKYTEAETEYREAIRIKPNYMAYNNLANTLLSQGRFLEAEAEARESIKLNPNYAFAHVALGMALHFQHKFTEAEAEYREALKIAPKFAEFHVRVGEILHSQNKFPEAEAKYQEALRLDPDTPDAHVGLGNILISQGKFSEAETEIREALRINTRHFDAHHSLSRVLYFQGKFSEAETEIREALKLFQNFAIVHNNLGEILSSQQKLPEAEAEFREAIRLDAKFADAHHALGVTLFFQNKFPEAETKFRDAIKLNDSSAVSHGFLGQALYRQNRLTEAEAKLRDAIRIDPKFANFHIALSDVLLDQKRIPEAVAELEETIRIDPKSAIAYNGLGNILYSQNKLSDAQAKYKEAIRVDPTFLMAHYNLAQASYARKKFSEAEAEYRETIRLNPNYAEAHHGLANALYQQKRYPEAEAEYREALRINPNFEPAREALKQLFNK